MMENFSLKLHINSTKHYLLIKEEIDVTRKVGKSKRQKCGFGIHAFYRARI